MAAEAFAVFLDQTIDLIKGLMVITLDFVQEQVQFEEFVVHSLAFGLQSLP